MFITFEGIDGSGKTTQIQLLTKKFPNALVTREPGGTESAEAVRYLFCKYSWDAVAELLLVSAGRRQHIKELIEPNLNKGIPIICDRFFDSTYIYQGVLRGVDFNLINQVTQIATDGLKPDYTFLLDMDPDMARNRINTRLSEEEKSKVAYDNIKLEVVKKMREAYLHLAENNKNRYHIIDGSQETQVIHQQICAILKIS